jgi:hypothetical protein
MFDTRTLRPVILAMTLYIFAVQCIPQFLKKPTNVKLVDDIVKYLKDQQNSMVSGVIVFGVIVYISKFV